MKTCRFAITFISLFVFVIIAAFTMAGQAKADAIVIDPGPPRPAPYEIDIPFNELNGTAVSGQSLSQDFIFADKEWIYVSSETHGVLLMLQTDYTGGMLLTCLPGTGFLLGESYAPLSVPMALNFPGPSNDGGRLIAALYTGDLMGQTIQLDTPFTYYGLHYDFTFPVLSGTEVTGAKMRIVRADWVSVPEPSTLLLLGSGIVGLIGFRKKFKK